MKVEEANVDYPCCPDPFAQVVFYLVLCRRPLFYIISIILPAVLLAVICLAVYILPPDSGEKISLGVTTLLALILFQELIGGSLPPSSDRTPIISKYRVDWSLGRIRKDKDIGFICTYTQSHIRRI